MTTVPFKPRADKKVDLTLVAVPESEAKIRENIVYLFFRLLGETVTPDSEEVTKTYNLFVDVWKDLEQTEFDKGQNLGLSNGRCNATVDYDKPARFELKTDGRLAAVYEQLRPRPDKAPYEVGMRIDRDENFTVRSWQSVMTYLMTDYRFTHE
jgi:hypothetical protein